MTLLAAFTVPGQPVPKARARVVHGKAYTPRRTAEAEERIAEYFKIAYPHMRPSVGRVRVVLRFHLKGVRSDADNLTKLVLDSLNRRAWVDDGQVDEIAVSVVRSSDTPQTCVEVWEM